MSNLGAVRFNLAGSVCSHGWRDCFFAGFFFVKQDKKGSTRTVQIFSSLLHHFEKRHRWRVSVRKKQESQEQERRAGTH